LIVTSASCLKPYPLIVKVMPPEKIVRKVLVKRRRRKVHATIINRRHSQVIYLNYLKTLGDILKANLDTIINEAVCFS